MTLRAGSADTSKPAWRGLIRNDSYPWYICYRHHHDNAASARECARLALAWMKENKDKLPEGWLTYKTFKETFNG